MAWTMEAKVKPAVTRPKLTARETEAMVRDIRKNGMKGYKTLDELLIED